MMILHVRTQHNECIVVEDGGMYYCGNSVSVVIIRLSASMDLLEEAPQVARRYLYYLKYWAY